jgi:CubicO group peptidase (beta-lactamase class C family)
LPLLFSLPCLAAEEGPSATLIEMRRHMLDPQINALTFHNMDELFTTFAVPAAGTPSALEEAPAGLDFSYQFDGETIPASAFGARTFTNALLIMRDDKIVHERYYNNTHADSRFLSMSMAKSFTSLLVGMAIADGLIGSVDDPVVQYVSELAGGGYDGVSIRQALLMRSGAD